MLALQCFVDMFGFNCVYFSFPSHNWEIWRFRSTNRKFWQSKQNQLDFIRALEAHCKIESLDDWYNVTYKQIFELGGRFFFLQSFGGSLLKLVATYYPAHEWLPWRFAKTPQRYWTEDGGKNQRVYFDWLMKKLNFSRMDEFYGVSHETLRANCGATLLNLHKHRIVKALSHAYPEHKFLPWKFTTRNIWADTEVQLAFLNWAAEQLDIPLTKTKDGCPPEEWYYVSKHDIVSLGGGALLRQYGPLPTLLAQSFPQWKFENWKFEQAPKLEFHPSSIVDSQSRAQLLACAHDICHQHAAALNFVLFQMSMEWARILE